jgi:hypothetical protein
MLGKLDHEIRDTEARIARERQMLVGSLHRTGTRVRDTVISPGALAAFAAAGFILGDVLRSRRRHATSAPSQARTIRSSLFGLLASGAMALIKARYGSPWGLASEVLHKANGTRRPQRAYGDEHRQPPPDWTGTAPPQHRGNGADPSYAPR